MLCCVLLHLSLPHYVTLFWQAVDFPVVPGRSNWCRACVNMSGECLISIYIEVDTDEGGRADREIRT